MLRDRLPPSQYWAHGQVAQGVKCRREDFNTNTSTNTKRATRRAALSAHRTSVTSIEQSSRMQAPCRRRRRQGREAAGA